MKWCRFQTGPHASYGIVEDDKVTEVAGSPFAEYRMTGASHPLSQVKLLPPVIPLMLYAAGPNYRGHVEGMARRRGAEPQYPTRPEPNFRTRARLRLQHRERRQPARVAGGRPHHVPRQELRHLQTVRAVDRD